MMVLAVGLLVAMTAGAVSTFDSRSLIALVVVIVVAAAGGIAFSWKRYYRRVPRTDR
jgi:multidrug resistance efflux pump